MKGKNIDRRKFIRSSALAAGALGFTKAGYPAGDLTTSSNAGTSSGQSRKRRLTFNSDGKFRIVQFTDIHAVCESGETDHAYDIMNKILDIEKPDFVIYTGDIVTDNNPAALWEKVTSLPSKRNIPFAVVFGNHDSERDTPRDKVYEIVVGLDGCLNEPKKESVDEVFGYTNQVIPVYKSDEPDETAFLFYLFDSNALNNIPGASLRDDWIRSNQIDWYVNQSRKLTNENDGIPYPALAFFHIPLVEFGLAYNTPNQKSVGWRIEKEGCPPVNSGLFAAFMECKDVKGVFVGHDHDNDYVVYHHGIALGYGRFSGGLNTYHTLCRGARVIELTEGEESFETWVRLETGRFLCRITVPYSFISDALQYKPKP
ncbi:MAG TPA: metallophosphoesterase family protein [Daejeonella sp.]|nr:metallophosphoesterase family protein [Daejeonella sp.]